MSEEPSLVLLNDSLYHNTVYWILKTKTCTTILETKDPNISNNTCNTLKLKINVHYSCNKFTHTDTRMKLM